MEGKKKPDLYGHKFKLYHLPNFSQIQKDRARIIYIFKYLNYTYSSDPIYNKYCSQYKLIYLFNTMTDRIFLNSGGTIYKNL